MIVYFAKRPHFITGGAFVLGEILFSSLSPGTITSPSKPLHSIKLKRVFWRAPPTYSRDNAIPFFSRTHK